MNWGQTWRELLKLKLRTLLFPSVTVTVFCIMTLYSLLLKIAARGTGGITHDSNIHIQFWLYLYIQFLSCDSCLYEYMPLQYMSLQYMPLQYMPHAIHAPAAHDPAVHVPAIHAPLIYAPSIHAPAIHAPAVHAPAIPPSCKVTIYQICSYLLSLSFYP